MSRLWRRLGQIEVNIIVGGIAGNHETDRRDMQTCRMIRVGVTKLNGDQLIPFQINHISFEFFRDHELVRNLVRESGLPHCTKEVWGGVLAHNANCIGRCNYFSSWESLKKRADSKPMVSVAMCNVDGRQVLAF